MTFSGTSIGNADSATSGELMLTDFSPDGPDLGWYVVNDNVMGGRSEGNFTLRQGELLFTGRTNTDGGGFSSIRSKPMQLDLSKHTGVQLYIKGDGRRYTWRLTTQARWRGEQVAYWADFETRDGAWSTVTIPFSDFIPRYRGSRLDGPALDPSQVTGMGLMIYDNQDGPFELHLGNVQAYSARASFTLSQYRWKNRVLVVSSPTEDDPKLRQQQDEVASAPEEFADRDMALVTLLDDAVSMAGDRQLTTGEVAATRTALRIQPGSFAVRLIGKDGGVKLSAETVTSMADVYALIDTMPMRQREMSGR